MIRKVEEVGNLEEASKISEADMIRKVEEVSNLEEASNISEVGMIRKVEEVSNLEEASKISEAGMILKIEEVKNLEEASKISAEAFGKYFGHFRRGSFFSPLNPDGSFTFLVKHEENFKVSLVDDVDLALDTLYVSTWIKERYFKDIDNITILENKHPLVDIKHDKE
jgi:hypothetical protein